MTPFWAGPEGGPTPSGVTGVVTPAKDCNTLVSSFSLSFEAHFLVHLESASTMKQVQRMAAQLRNGQKLQGKHNIYNIYQHARETPKGDIWFAV